MNREAFYVALRSRDSKAFGGPLSVNQVLGTEALLDEGERRDLPLAQLAYVLATAYHETAHTMQPIAEYGRGRDRPYGRTGKYQQAQYGRGYVQLTWDANYERADRELGLNGALLRDFDLALKPDIAAAILFQGMIDGWFTTKKLADYISGDKADYFNARRIVNGTDRAGDIAEYAISFLEALEAAGYGQGNPLAHETPPPASTQPDDPGVDPDALVAERGGIRLGTILVLAAAAIILFATLAMFTR